MDKLKYVKLENPDGSYSDPIALSADAQNIDVGLSNLNTYITQNNNNIANLQQNDIILDNKINSNTSAIQSLASGSPAGVYATVAALTTADPDHSKIYIVTADGHWYYYNSGWQDGGLYQSASDHDEIEDARKNFNGFIDTSLGESIRNTTINFANNLDFINEEMLNSYGLMKLSFNRYYHQAINSLTGNTISSSDYYSTDYIDVSKFNYLLVSFVGGGHSSQSNLVGVAGYDENYDFVERLMDQNKFGGRNGSRSSITNAYIKLSKDVKYIKASTAYKNDANSSYPYSELLILGGYWENLNNKNLLMNYDWEYLTWNISGTSAYIKYDTGEEISASHSDYVNSFITSPFIPVNENDTFYISASFLSTYNGICGYDENYECVETICSAPQILGSYDINHHNNASIKNYIYTIPNNVKYIRGSSFENPLIIKMIKGNNLNKDFLSFKTFYGESVYARSGNISTNSDYCRTDFINVVPGEKIYFTGVLGGQHDNELAGIAGYDENENFVTSVFDKTQYFLHSIGGRAYFENQEITIPEGVYKIIATSAWVGKVGSNYNYWWPYSKIYIAKNLIQSIDEENITNELNKDMQTSLVACSDFNSYVSGGYQNPVATKKNLTISIISDIHGTDNSLKRFINFNNANSKYLDFALCLGDSVLRSPSDNFSWFENEIITSTIPFRYTVGNHDTADTGLSSITEAQAKIKYFNKIINQSWLSASDFMDTNKCSWFKDLSTYKIRIISLFEYENSLELSRGAPGAYCRRWLDTATLQWFADTLYSTPNDYSVIVLLHQFPYYPLTFVENNFTISSSLRKPSTLNSVFLNTVDGNPIEEVVNAFIHSTNIEKTYSSIPSFNLGKTATVSKDFSQRTVNGHFICYLSGHQHGSYVTKSNTYPDQINISIPSGSESTYQRSYGDTNYDVNRNMDNFYVIGINTTLKKINICQIGNQTTKDMIKRDFISVSY